MSRFEFAPVAYRSGVASYIPGAMKSAGLILGMAGLLLIFRYSEGEFAGSAEDEARRVKFRRTGIGLVLVGLILQAWSEYA